MASFHFEGVVLPDIRPLSIDYRPSISRTESEGDPEAIFETSVVDGTVRVDVSTATVSKEIVHQLFMPAWDLARSLVETAGYIEGVPYLVSIDRAVLPDGEVMPLMLCDRKLAATHNFDQSDIPQLADIFLLDLRASLALSDLLMMLGKSHYSPIACGRVADSIARLMSPSENRAAAWGYLRSELRADEPFVQLLSKTSAASRHGDRQYISADITSEIARRAWTLMYRYLRWRVDGRLNAQEFPLLRG